MPLTAAQRSALFARLRQSPEFHIRLGAALDQMVPGGHYTVVTERKERQRTVSGVLVDYRDGVLRIKDEKGRTNKVVADDIVRITYPNGNNVHDC